MKRLNDETGQAASMVLVFLLALMGVAGLVIDGGVLFSARRSLQSLADGAARAGAMQLDEPLLRATDGREVALDPDAAERASSDYLTSQGFEGIVAIKASSLAVDVRVSQDRKTLLLSLVGVRTMAAEASASAYPSTGERRMGG